MITKPSLLWGPKTQVRLSQAKLLAVSGVVFAILQSPLVLLASESTKPNIVFIMADDLGYGDVQCLNPERGKIPTPHLDHFAAQGMTLPGLLKQHGYTTACIGKWHLGFLSDSQPGADPNRRGIGSSGLPLEATIRGGLRDNTLVIITSDNGCAVSAGPR